MKTLIDLPNIGKILAKKLELVGITNEQELINDGAENAIIKIAALENSEVCINMLYALDGAIEGIRWHNLSKERKHELKEFFLMNKKIKFQTNFKRKK